jgi:hypothetical protein
MEAPEKQAVQVADEETQSNAGAGAAPSSMQLQQRSHAPPHAARACCCGCCASIRAELRSGAPGGAPPDWRLWFAPPSGAARRIGMSANAVLALRILLALFMDAVLFGSVTLMSATHEGYWCIYLTHWTLVAVCAHLTLSAAAAIAARVSLARGEPRRATRAPWLPVLWSAQAIALPGSLLVFILFWHAHTHTHTPLHIICTPSHTPPPSPPLSRALVYPGTPSLAAQPINYFVHGVNFGAMALDAALLSSAPYFFVYIWTSWLAYAIIYVLFTITYSRAHGTDENGNVRGWRGLQHASSCEHVCNFPHAACVHRFVCAAVFPALRPAAIRVRGGELEHRHGRGQRGRADRHHRVYHCATSWSACLLPRVGAAPPPG